jgi:hypothetical protein
LLLQEIANRLNDGVDLGWTCVKLNRKFRAFLADPNQAGANTDYKNLVGILVGIKVPEGSPQANEGCVLDQPVLMRRWPVCGSSQK